ncbi:PHD finger protein 11 isoform X3 [Sus scrofa]|uniref:PHD finger protein 11 isoform X3 n=1 Tax=Sus scrofa TaxID=9823 RepID=UPI0006B15A2B|nr:PHD finger protein 11 isoform X3 [Sus scrofa]
MDAAWPSDPKAARAGRCAAEDGVPLPTGVFHVAEKLQKRTCALCPEDLDYSVLYFSQSEDLAAHENCLLYSSGLVECESDNPSDHERNFDVESVKKEIKRGRKLKCTFCGKKGATVGCDLKSCLKNYHFFCAKKDHAVLQTDKLQGTYRVFCTHHAGTQKAGPENGPRKRGRKRLSSTGNHAQPSESMALNRPDYEEIGASLFDCSLLEGTFLTFRAEIENKIHQSEQRRQQLDKEIKLLQDIKDTLGSLFPSSSPSNSSLSS